MNDEFLLIQDNETYYRVVQEIENLDILINYVYNAMAKYSEPRVIIDFQDWINRLKNKRLGYFNLTALYNLKKDVPNFKLYIVRQNDTLALISMAFYGRTDFASYIYVENDLTDWNLTIGQSLRIPVVHPNREGVFAKEYIDILDKNGK